MTIGITVTITFHGLAKLILVVVLVELCLWVFSYQCQLMVFHWNPSNIQSPEISRILLSTPAYFNCAAVWMVSILPLIPSCFQVHQRSLVSPSSSCFTVLQFSGKIQVLSFRFLYFHFGINWNRKIHQLTSCYFNSSGRYLIIPLYLKVPENFMCFISLNRFWFVPMPFVSMSKF